MIRKMNLPITTLLFSLSLLTAKPLYCQQEQRQALAAEVTYITDGDTFTARQPDGVRIRIRPIGIDADEIRDNSHGKKGPFAQAAKAYLANLIKGKKVRLVTDVRRYDKYGRLLAYVYVDSIFVNAEMLKAGLAKTETEPPNVKYADYFYRLQVAARKAGKGMWKQ